MFAIYFWCQFTGPNEKPHLVLVGEYQPIVEYCTDLMNAGSKTLESDMNFDCCHFPGLTAEQIPQRLDLG